MKSKSSEKICRALQYNISHSQDSPVLTGDNVYYKRAPDSQWRGLDTEIGQDGQQVLLKHGGFYIQVHPCRVQRARHSHDEVVSPVKKENAPLKLLSTTSKGGKPLTTSESSDTDSDIDTMSAPDIDPVNTHAWQPT